MDGSTKKIPKEIIDLIKQGLPDRGEQFKDIVAFVDETICRILDKYGYSQFEDDAPINFSSIKQSFLTDKNPYNLTFKEEFNKGDVNREIRIYLKGKLISTFKSRFVNQKMLNTTKYNI